MGGRRRRGDAGRRRRTGAIPRVSTGLADILHKCLAPSPRTATPTPRRWRSTSGGTSERPAPPRGAEPEPGRSAGGSGGADARPPWRAASLRLAVFSSLLTLLVIAVAHDRRKTRQVEAALAEGREHWQHRPIPEATLALGRGLELAGHLPDDDGRKRAIGGGPCDRS